MRGNLAYIVVSLLFSLTYLCCLLTLYATDWIRLFDDDGLVNYGLFKRCVNFKEAICREFPSEEYGDCNRKGFCEEWREAGYDMILAAVSGGLALFYSVAVLLSGKVHSEHAWKILFGLILFHSLLEFSSVGTIRALSEEYFIGKEFDLGDGYKVANSCAILNLLISGLIFIIGLTYSTSYEPIR